MTKTLDRSNYDKSNYKLTFAVLLLGTVAYALLQSLVLPVLPTIQHELHTSQSTVTWVLTAYLLSASIATPILGRLGDMVGKERMLVTTLSALALGSVLAGFSNSIGLLIVARSIQGIGGAVLPLAFGIIRDEFPAVKVAGGVGIVAAMAAVGGGAGIVLAGPIVDHLNFHWLFWIPLIICVIAVVCAKLFVPESPIRTPGRVSWLAAILLSGWLVALLVAVSEAPTWGWGSSKVTGLIVVAAILIFVWIVAELRSRTPLVDMYMMRVRAVWTNNLVAFLFGVGMYSVMGFLPEYLQTPRSAGYGFGASIIQSGLYLLPLTVTMFVFGLLSGRIAARVGSKSAVIAGSMASTVAYLVLAFAHSQPWEIYLASTLLGVGLGLAFSAMSNLIVQAVPLWSDGRRQRHEREHPDNRGCRRRRHNVQHRDVPDAQIGRSCRVGIHQRICISRGHVRNGNHRRLFHSETFVIARRRGSRAPRSRGARRTRPGPRRNHLRMTARRPQPIRKPRSQLVADPLRHDRRSIKSVPHEIPALRRDAARNRVKILAAALAVFDEEGVDVGVEVIAQRAGVGMGTLYRRFPTKELLIDAVVDELLEKVHTTARSALENQTAADGFGEFLRAVGWLQSEHSGCLGRLWSSTDSEWRNRIEVLTRTLLTRAQDAGSVRADLVYEDVIVLFWSLRGVIEATSSISPDAWLRYFELLLSSLAPSVKPLEHPPLTAEEAHLAKMEASFGGARNRRQVGR